MNAKDIQIGKRYWIDFYIDNRVAYSKVGRVIEQHGKGEWKVQLKNSVVIVKSRDITTPVSVCSRLL